MRTTPPTPSFFLSVLISMGPGSCYGQRGVILSPWDFRADTSVAVVKEARDHAQSAVEVVGGAREREVLDAATKCVSSLYKDLHVVDSPARVARFRDNFGDSWMFRWSDAHCMESTICLRSLTDTPHNTMMEVLLPSGDLVRILEESIRWSTGPIQLGNMHLYSNQIGTADSAVALLGGVPGSSWLGGFGFWGIVETSENQRTMRVLLGKRHCKDFYPKDLYFSSRRFSNLSTEAKKLGLAALVADIRGALRSHRYAFPATDLEILMSELASREPTTAIIRQLIQTAIWPLDSHSRYRMQLVTDHFFRDTDFARRNLGILAEEMNTFLGSYQRASVRSHVPSHIAQIPEDLLRFFQWREDDVSIEDVALLFVREPQFTEGALKYLEVKASSRAAETLRRAAVPPEFESARNSTVQKISERLKSRADRQ